MRIGIVGGGWRSEYFLRIAKACPEEFEIAAISRTTREKAEESRAKWGFPVCVGIDELLALKPDYVILSIPRSQSPALLKKLLEAGMPVMCETPPAATTEQLCELWELSQRTQVPLLVAEQYFLQPYHNANISLIQQGLLGEVVSMRNSMMHGYHGINIMRNVLGVGMERCRISGRVDNFRITRTGGRNGIITSGEVDQTGRELFFFDFEGGKTGYWDFTGVQYHSYIRSRHFSVEGTRGEINDTTVRFLDEGNMPHELEYRRLDTGHYSDLDGYQLQGLMLGERRVWTSPFPGARLNDDEIAVAGLMRNLGEHVKGNAPLCYPLAEALQDSYLSFCHDEAMRTGNAVETVDQPWSGR